MAGDITPVTFSLQFVSINISSFTLSGFAEGDAMTLEYPNDDFEMQASSDGLVIFIQKHNPTCDGMIRLGQGNALISPLRQLHQLSLDAGGIHYPFTAKNLKSPDEEAAGSLLFKKQPPIKWSDSAQPAEFAFFLTASRFAGGTILPT